MNIGPNVVILTREELAARMNQAFQRGREVVAEVEARSRRRFGPDREAVALNPCRDI